jgi:site-specific recombinase XerC
MQNNGWLTDPVIVEWFEVVKTKRTQDNYKREFPIFFEFLSGNPETKQYTTPSEIIESRKVQLKSDDMAVRRFWETVGIKYMHSLEDKKYRKGTIATYLRTMLSFFSHAHLQLQYARKELLGAIEPSEKEKVQKDWVPSNEDVRLLYRMAEGARERSILLTLYQSGFAPADTCAFNIEHFEFYNRAGEWQVPSGEDYYVGKLREKTNILTQTCLSRENLEEIRIMLQLRDFPKKGPLFVSVHGQRLATRDVNDIMKAIVKVTFGSKAELWETKNLRDSYRNALTKAKIPDDCIDAMFGHQRQGAKGHYNLSEDTIVTMYADAFRFLSINGYGAQSSKLVEIQQKFDAQTKTVMELIAELREENKALKAENEKLRVNMVGIDRRMTTIENSTKQRIGQVCINPIS